MSNNSPPDSFDSLVINAIDFLERSAKDFESNPKYTVINFHSAVELLLKARLLQKEWSLVLENPKKADETKFAQGDFRSVGLGKAMGRLKTECSIDIPNDAKRAFFQLKKHRNRLVHFYHPEYVDPDRETLEKIAIEQCRAWFYVLCFVHEESGQYFQAHLEEMRRVNQIMYQYKKFLDTKYEQLKSEIERETRQGRKFINCRICEHQSVGLIESGEPLIKGTCRVCEARQGWLEVPCPACGADIVIHDMGEGECSECNEQVDIDYLIRIYGPDISHLSPKDMDLSPPSVAYCSFCEYIDQPSVIPFNDHWLCLCCLEEYDYAAECDWCSSFIAGDLSEGYLTGCMFCDGLTLA